jgi:hypothetical protein
MLKRGFARFRVFGKKKQMTHEEQTSALYDTAQSNMAQLFYSNLSAITAGSCPQVRRLLSDHIRSMTSLPGPPVPGRFKPITVQNQSIHMVANAMFGHRGEVRLI